MLRKQHSQCHSAKTVHGCGKKQAVLNRGMVPLFDEQIGRQSGGYAAAPSQFAIHPRKVADLQKLQGMHRQCQFADAAMSHARNRLD